MGDTSGYLLQALGAFALIVVFLLVAVCAARRWQPGAGLLSTRPGRLRLVETLVLMPTARVAIVEADGEELLVGATAQQVTLLARLGPREAVDSQGSEAQGAKADGPGARATHNGGGEAE